MNSSISEKSIVFEVFTDNQSESDALLSTWSLEKDRKTISQNIKSDVVNKVRSVLGERGLTMIKLMH